MPGHRSEGVKVFLQTSSKVKSLAQEEESADTRAQAVRVLSGLSKKFHSFALVELASRARSDPFGKVRGLIEDMIVQSNPCNPLEQVRSKTGET